MDDPTEQPKEGKKNIKLYTNVLMHPSCRSELERVVGELRRAIAEEPCSDTHIIAAFDRRCGELGVEAKKERIEQFDGTSYAGAPNGTEKL